MEVASKSVALRNMGSKRKFHLKICTLRWAKYALGIFFQTNF